MIANDHTTGEGLIALERATDCFTLTFEGYRGLETVVRFDHAVVGDHTLSLYRQGDILIAEIEVDRTFCLTSVASALRAIEHNQLGPEADA